MRRKKILIPVVLTAAALLVWAFVRPDVKAEGSFRFVTVERGSIESVVTSTGTLQATETIEVGTQVSGQIAELLVDFNSRVKKGQLLARIDPTILQQEVSAAQANVLRNRAEVEQAERELERNRDLIAKKVITASEFEQSQYGWTVAKAALTSAEVSLERARRNLGYTEIRAPIDGVVVERSVDVGQTVAASMSAPTLFLIAQDLSQMEILASVDESDIGRIHEGQEARFTVQAYGAESFTGAVEQVRLKSTTTENVVSYGVVVRVSNPDGRLLPGMTATVEFVVESADDVLKVANTALRFQPTDAMRAQVADRLGNGATAAGRAGTAQSVDGRADSGAPPAANAGARMRPSAAATRAGGAANRGAVWTIDDAGKVSVVRVQTGLSDGQYTEIRGEGVTDGMQVVAGIASAGAAEAAPNPFQNSQQRGPGGASRF